jgi:hypothetical protein
MFLLLFLPLLGRRFRRANGAFRDSNFYLITVLPPALSTDFPPRDMPTDPQRPPTYMSMERHGSRSSIRWRGVDKEQCAAFVVSTECEMLLHVIMLAVVVAGALPVEAACSRW